MENITHIFCRNILYIPAPLESEYLFYFIKINSKKQYQKLYQIALIFIKIILKQIF